MFAFISNTRARLRQEEKGATAVEYGIMVALIAVAIITAVTFLGAGLTKSFNDIGCQVQNQKWEAATAPATGGGCVAK